MASPRGCPLEAPDGPNVSFPPISTPGFRSWEPPHGQVTDVASGSSAHRLWTWGKSGSCFLIGQARAPGSSAPGTDLAPSTCEQLE